MRKYFYVLALTLVAGFWNACKTTYSKPADPTEAGRDFINASLKADYSIADDYVLQDTINQYIYGRYKQQYQSMPQAEKDSYSKSSLIIYSVKKPTDSSAVIEYANTFKNQRMTLHMVRSQGEWWVDLANTLNVRDSFNTASDTSNAK
jgi:hypothetical protein